VRAWIAGIGDQRLDLAVLDVERVQNLFLENKRSADSAQPKRKPAGGKPWAGS
jgi:hypothetical protein